MIPTTPAKGKGKGKGKEKGGGEFEDPQSVPAVAKRGCVISPNKEGRSNEPDCFGSRPMSTGDHTGYGSIFEDTAIGEFDEEPAPRKPLP
ncbi:hypothetical protein FRC11_014644, partial [Ceratobasidium sp. 423]